MTTGRLDSRTFVTAADLRTIRGTGHLVGAHSHTHPSVFRSLDWESMLLEWRISADIVSQTIGERCLAASVPGGDLSSRVLRSADAAGFHYCFTSEPTLVPVRFGGSWVIGRVCLKTTTPVADVGRYVALKGWQSARALLRLKGVARVLLGPAYRDWVRRREPERPV